MDMLPEMASNITPTCNLIFGILKCNLPKDLIDVDLKIHTFRGTLPTRKTGALWSTSTAFGELKLHPSKHSERR